MGGIRHLFRVEAICGKETSRSQDWDDPGWRLEDHYDHSNGMEVASQVGKASRRGGVHVQKEDKFVRNLGRMHTTLLVYT